MAKFDHVLARRLEQVIAAYAKTPTPSYASVVSLHGAAKAVSAGAQRARVLLSGKVVVITAKMAVDEALTVLGVDKSVLGDAAALKKAYRDASLKSHPDRGGSTEDQQRVNEAYDLLQISRSSGTYNREAEQAEYVEKVRQVLPFVKASWKETFRPERFTAHFEKLMGKKFKATVDTNVREGYNKVPMGLRTTAEWRSDDGDTVFSMSAYIEFAGVVKTRSLGGDSGNLAYAVSIGQESLHDGRKAKMKRWEWSHSSDASQLDPEALWPSAKLKRVSKGKEKARKYSKRDFVTAVEKYLDGVVRLEGSGGWVFIPVGKADPELEKAYENSFKSDATDPARSVVGLWRSAMSFKGEKHVSYSWGAMQGPRTPKKSRVPYNTINKSLPESEDTINRLRRAVKLSEKESDPRKIGKIFERELFKGSDADQPKAKPAPAPIDFGDVVASLRAAADKLQFVDGC